MPRRPRDTSAGVFHVYTHSVWAAEAMFRDDIDRLALLRELPVAIARGGWSCIAFCLMTTHHHLIVEAPDGGLPVGMHWLNFRYATAFNGRHSMKGHVHGRRYGSTRISDDDFLLDRFKYVARNPLEANLCEEPADWPWSSYASAVGMREPHSFVDPMRVLTILDDRRDVAVARLRAFVEKP
jgi:putative transposase